MKLFENGVGRPSNEIKKKRRLFVAGISLAVALLVGLGSILTINATKQNIVSNPKKLKAEASTLDLKLADLDKDGKVTRNDLVKLKERLKSIYPYSMPGDINLDGKVDTLDLSIVTDYFKYRNAQSKKLLVELKKQELADINGDGNIDEFDLSILVLRFRRSEQICKVHANGDLNEDCKVNKTDYKLLMKYLDTNEKITSKTINGDDLKVSANGNNSGNYGSNTKTGSYWGSGGLNIYAQRKGTETVATITELGDLSQYSRISIYYKYAGDGKDMKSSIGFYMNGVKRYKKNVTLTTNKEGTTKWSGTQKVQFGLYNEVGNDNLLYVNLDHGTNKNANTAILKITKIVLE